MSDGENADPPAQTEPDVEAGEGGNVENAEIPSNEATKGEGSVDVPVSEPTNKEEEAAQVETKTDIPELPDDDTDSTPEKDSKIDCYYVVLAVILGAVLLGVLVYFSVNELVGQKAIPTDSKLFMTTANMTNGTDWGNTTMPADMSNITATSPEPVTGG